MHVMVLLFYGHLKKVCLPRLCKPRVTFGHLGDQQASRVCQMCLLLLVAVSQSPLHLIVPALLPQWHQSKAVCHAAFFVQLLVANGNRLKKTLLNLAWKMSHPFLYFCRIMIECMLQLKLRTFLYFSSGLGTED